MSKALGVGTKGRGKGWWAVRCWRAKTGYTKAVQSLEARRVRLSPHTCRQEGQSCSSQKAKALWGSQCQRSKARDPRQGGYEIGVRSQLYEMSPEWL